MKKSQEYIAEHYPQFTRQWLCNANWEGNEEWCCQYGLNPSISIGNFDANTVKSFHRMGLNVAMWTVDSRENYLKYGKMGVYMMTCNSLNPSDMPDLEDVDWGADALQEPHGDTLAVSTTEYYSPSTGMCISKGVAAGGICISVTHLSDGSVLARKVLLNP